MPENVLSCVQVGKKEMSAALEPIISGDGAKEFWDAAKQVLTDNANYGIMLLDAEIVGLDPDSVDAGFIAGLAAAAKLSGTSFSFLDENHK